MLYLIFYVLLAHLVGDFYLQAKRMPVRILLNGLLFSLALYSWSGASNVSLTGAYHIVFLASLGVVATHLATDILQDAIPAKSPSADFSVFVLKQTMHVVMFVWIVYGYLQPHIYIARPPALEPNYPLIADFILLLCTTLFLLRPSSLLVSKFLSMAMLDTKMDHINMTKSHLSDIFYESIRTKLGQLLAQPEMLNAAKVDTVLLKSQYNTNLIARELRNRTPNTDVSGNFPSNQAGKWIGYIERVMIFLFFIVGQYAAIAAVMAIKTAFRFNDLKDDNDSHRSEYIMIGTFVSFFITMMTAVVVRQILVGHGFSQAAAGLLTRFL